MNAVRGAEATILFDIITTIHNKSYNIQQGVLTVAFNNKKLWRMTHRELKTSNQHNQDSAAEENTIRKIIESTTIEISLNRINSHKELRTSYQ